jgi:hypothetical protein
MHANPLFEDNAVMEAAAAAVELVAPYDGDAHVEPPQTNENWTKIRMGMMNKGHNPAILDTYMIPPTSPTAAIEAPPAPAAPATTTIHDGTLAIVPAASPQAAPTPMHDDTLAIVEDDQDEMAVDTYNPPPPQQHTDAPMQYAHRESATIEDMTPNDGNDDYDDYNYVPRGPPIANPRTKKAVLEKSRGEKPPKAPPPAAAAKTPTQGKVGDTITGNTTTTTRDVYNIHAPQMHVTNITQASRGDGMVRGRGVDGGVDGPHYGMSGGTTRRIKGGGGGAYGRGRSRGSWNAGIGLASIGEKKGKGGGGGGRKGASGAKRGPNGQFIYSALKKSGTKKVGGKSKSGRGSKK